jgi:hypothetical protein
MSDFVGKNGGELVISQNVAQAACDQNRSIPPRPCTELGGVERVAHHWARFAPNGQTLKGRTEPFALGWTGLTSLLRGPGTPNARRSIGRR